MTQNTEKSRSPQEFVSRYLGVGLTISLGILVTVLAFAKLRSLEQRSMENRFLRLAEPHAAAWIDTIENRIGALDSLHGLYESSNHVTRDEFRLFAERSVLRYGGIRSVWWVPRVQGDARHAFEQEARCDGLENFRITEHINSSSHESQSGPCFPLYYVEPFVPNAETLGYDIGSEPSWREVLDRARDTDNPTVASDVCLPETDPNSGVFYLVQPVRNHLAILPIVADSRENLQGFLIAILDLGGMANSVLVSSHPEGVELELLRTTNTGLQCFYVRPPRMPSSRQTSMFLGHGDRAWVWEKPFDLGNERWIVRCRSIPALLHDHNSWTSLACLGIGLVITCLASSQVWSNRVRCERVSQLVAERTRELTESKAALKNHNEFLNHILASLGHPLYVIDANDFTVKVTNQSQDLVGLPHNPTCYKLIYGKNQPCNKQTVICPIIEVRTTKKPAVFERAGSEEEGPSRVIEVRAYPVLDSNGNVTEVIEYHLDITERKRAVRKAEEQKDLLSHIISIIPAYIFWKDRDSRFLGCNEIFAKAAGLGNPDEIVGKSDYDLIWKNDADQYQHADRLVMNSKEPKLNFEEWQTREDGRQMALLTSKVPLTDAEGTVIGILGVYIDITERKQIEQRQGVLVDELKSINDELRDFAYIVSHDLKAPLRGIRTLAEWIETDFGERLGEEGTQQIRLLMGRVDRMQDLINGILEYSRIGRVSENREVVDTGQLVADLIADLAVPDRISLDVADGLPTVYGEPTRIRQLFQNLLSNAVKYMDKKQGTIRVGCTEEVDQWQFFIADNGPGIEEKHFQRIFQLFQTLSARDEIEGTGIGLTVAKKIVEHHGGRIWVESRLREGSTFFFTMPKTQLEAIHADREATVAC